MAKNRSFDHIKTRAKMVKSRPNMSSAVKRLQAFLFLVIVVLPFPRQVFAQGTDPDCATFQVNPTTLSAADSSISVSFNPGTGLKNSDQYRFTYQTINGTQHSIGFSQSSGVQNHTFNFSYEDLKKKSQTISLESGSRQFCLTNILIDGNDGVVGEPGTGMPATSFDLCQQSGVNRSACDQCLANKEIWTGVGCIPFGTQGGMVRSLITLGLGITGTLVVLMTLYAGFMFSTSQGDPKRVDEAKSAMTSAIIGAFFIIFSVTILQFIGVTILRLPSFG